MDSSHGSLGDGDGKEESAARSVISVRGERASSRGSCVLQAVFGKAETFA